MKGAWIPAAVVVLGLACPGALEPARAGARGQPRDDEPVALEVEILDGLSGAPVRGARADFVPGSGRWAGRTHPMKGDGARLVLDDTGFVRGERAAHRIEVALPPGWIREVEEKYTPYPPVVTLLTRTLRRTVIAWPEADIRVRVLWADGTAADGICLRAERLVARLKEEWLTYSRHRHTSSFQDSGKGLTGPDGSGRIRGVPAIPGSRYTVDAYAQDRSATSGEVTLEPASATVTMEIRLPEEPDRGGTFFSSRSGSSYG